MLKSQHFLSDFWLPELKQRFSSENLQRIPFLIIQLVRDNVRFADHAEMREDLFYSRTARCERQYFHVDHVQNFPTVSLLT